MAKTGKRAGWRPPERARWNPKDKLWVHGAAQALAGHFALLKRR